MRYVTSAGTETRSAAARNACMRSRVGYIERFWASAVSIHVIRKILFGIQATDVVFAHQENAQTKT